MFLNAVLFRSHIVYIGKGISFKLHLRVESNFRGATTEDEDKRGSLRFRRSKGSLSTLSDAQQQQQRVPTGKYAVVVDGDTLREARELRASIEVSGVECVVRAVDKQ